MEDAEDGRWYGPGVTLGVGLMSMRERTLARSSELEIDSEPGDGIIARLGILASALRRRNRLVDRCLRYPSGPRC